MSKSGSSLLKKYEIPINHLSYEYVEECKDVRELEKIIKILRSGEEGLYPQLVERAETKLHQLDPKSRVLRKDVPALDPTLLDNQQWQEVDSQLKEWSKTTKQVDADLTKEYELLAQGNEDVPIRGNDDVPIRGSNDLAHNPLNLTNNNIKTNKIVEISSTKSQEMKRSVKPRSFADWDKFDADEELLRLETDEERQVQATEKERKKAKMYKPMVNFTRPHTTFKPPVSPQEKQANAEREKTKGNEYFKTGEYRHALYFYSISIKIHPTVAVYNNRALCYFRTKEYKACIADCGAALKLDPVNVKALYRRACARREVGEEVAAYADLMAALDRHPNNRDAVKLAHELVAIADASRANPESRRLSPSEPSAIGRREDTPDYPGDYPPSLAGGDYQHLPRTIHVAPKYHMTKWGLPSVMCKCVGPDSWVHAHKDCTFTKLTDPERDVPEQPCRITEITEPEKTDDTRRFEAAKERCTITEVFEPNVNEIDKTVNVQNGVDAGMVSKLQRCRITELAEEDVVMEPAEAKGGKRMRIVEVKKVEEMEVKKVEEMDVKEDTKVETKAEVKPVEEIVPTMVTTEKKGDEKIAATISKAGRRKRRKAKTNSNHVLESGDGNVKDSSTESLDGSFFLLKWATLRDPSYLQHAKLLSRIKPEDLDKTIGNSLDEQMLSTFLACLDQHWTVFSPPLAHEYLVQISKLQRFSFVHCFLEKKDKLAVKNILTSLRKHNIEVSHTLEAVYEI